MKGCDEKYSFWKGCRLLFAMIIFYVLLLPVKSSGQNEAYLYRVNEYNFVRPDLNTLHNFGMDEHSAHFYNKLEKLLKTGEGRINIVHIGGSHIQAGTFSGQIRNRLQTLDGDMNAGFGFMFPYRISRTNSPFGYYIRYNGAWQSCRNVEKRKSDPLGVGGIAATTSAPKTELTILLEEENLLDYRFDKIRIMYENQAGNYTLSIDSLLLKSFHKTSDFIDIELNEKVDSLKITFQKDRNKKGSFTLFGIISESAPNGFLYHSIGVNGAHVPAFNRCQLFEEQMADLQPDLVILGLGINDAYGRRFSQKKYENEYTELVEKIRRASPKSAIIFTTNNDSYLYRRYVNKNATKVRESMLRLGEKHQAGVWDMFSVMGGLNSIVMWQKNKLAQRDRIHFTREGYLLLGDLFFNALMQDFEEYLQDKNQYSEIRK